MNSSIRPTSNINTVKPASISTLETIQLAYKKVKNAIQTPRGFVEKYAKAAKKNWPFVKDALQTPVKTTAKVREFASELFGV
ncbi:MAG: hypothetical protein KR126chlam4_01400 [Candidatus Anoxychlamydiales bacterium]|uniref:Uncharacterized protein n=1 Tax=marine sediment metagenome TaxID=412755 RepID=A0A0F9HLN2_9ZZZZ|nr:hypothetical protein [Candidatus Anoxychlamydiales bacterium]NGX41558.1 hypothetical protein [Candidatus Anoxychlamydiales bacterium]HEU64493.1 hypothetical protein [Chlamydiota bacterium]